MRIQDLIGKDTFLGTVYVSDGVKNALEEDRKNGIVGSVELRNIIRQYANGEWGEHNSTFKPFNDISLNLKAGEITAAYDTSIGRIWICTTFPDERTPEADTTTIVYYGSEIKTLRLDLITNAFSF